MTSSQTLIDSLVLSLDEEGFVPYEQKQTGKSPMAGRTLHEAIRHSLGMKETDSIYMYWEWRELKVAFDTLWSDLDRAASSISGRRTSAIAFCTPQSRSHEEVLAMLRAVDTSEAKDFPTASRRPTKSEPQVRFTGKLLGAIFMSMGTLEATRDSGFGDLFSSLAQSSPSNIQLLALLDDCLRDELGDVGEARPPQSIVILRALGWAIQHTNEIRVEEELTPLSLAEFFVETESTANWAGMSDKVILRRLLAMAPDEKSEASKKAIEKFLSE